MNAHNETVAIVPDHGEVTVRVGPRGWVQVVGTNCHLRWDEVEFLDTEFVTTLRPWPGEVLRVRR